MSIIFCFLAPKGFPASKPFEIEAKVFGKMEFVEGTLANILITIRNISGDDQIQVFEGIWYTDGEPCGNVIEGVVPLPPEGHSQALYLSACRNFGFETSANEASFIATQRHNDPKGHRIFI